MKWLLVAFILCVFSVSCSHGNKIKIPKDILSQDTMVEVMTDVHLMQAAQRMGVNMDTTDTATLMSFQYVWKKHHITETDYKRNLDFYTHNPNILDSIYEKVLDTLSKQRAELLGKKENK